MTKYIVITGATGVVGRRAVAEMLVAGHRVTGVTRSSQGARLLEGLGARAVVADVFDPISLAGALAGADAVVNLLTHIPPADRMARPGAWDENDRLRREATGWAPRVRGGTDGWRLILEAAPGRMTAEERFARARPRLLRLAYAELGDLGEAEDVVQEAWLRLVRTGAESIDDLDAWLTTVVGRLALDTLRSARVRREAYVGPWRCAACVSARLSRRAGRGDGGRGSRRPR